MIWSGVETALWNRVETEVQRTHGVPLAWVEVMQVTAGQPRCRVMDIARALSITVGGASKVVDRLETAGLCRRLPNPTDRRSNLLELTQPGRSLLAAANLTFAAALADCLKDAAPAGEAHPASVTLRRLRSHLAGSELLEPAMPG